MRFYDNLNFFTMERLLSNEKMYDLLKMRANGFGYRKIGEVLGLTHKQVSNQYRSVLVGYRGGFMGTVKRIAEMSGEPMHEIVALLKVNIELPATEKPELRITIKGTTNPKVWYAQKIGKTYHAKKTLNGYWINNNPLFNVKHNDCIEVTG